MSTEFLILLNKIKKLDRLHVQKVTQLPATGQPNVLYFLVDGDGYEIWNYEDTGWEDLGKAKIDLDDYATISQLLAVSSNLSVEIENRIDAQEGIIQAVNQESDRARQVEESLDICIEERMWGNGESGYRKYRNGRLEQWGVTRSNAGGEQDFTMHTPNRDMNFSIFVTPREMGNFFYYAYPKTNNKFACRIQTRDSQNIAVSFQWLSIGRWK